MGNCNELLLLNLFLESQQGSSWGMSFFPLTRRDYCTRVHMIADMIACARAGLQFLDLPSILESMGHGARIPVLSGGVLSICSCRGWASLGVVGLFLFPQLSGEDRSSLW